MVACCASARGWPTAGSSAWGLAGAFESTIRESALNMLKAYADASAAADDLEKTNPATRYLMPRQRHLSEGSGEQ
jgi:hypothetical protein